MKKIIFILLLFSFILPVFAEDVYVRAEDRIAYPESWAGLSKEEINLNILNVLTRISALKGQQYISRMAGYKPKVLFEDSYCISNPDEKKSRIEDPYFETLVDEYELFAYQKDNRFGGNTYVLNYKIDEDSVELSIVNHTPMRFAGVSCVKANCLTMKLKVSQTEDCLVVSSEAFVPNQKAKISFVFYTVDLESSFDRRITALKNWFVEQLER